MTVTTGPGRTPPGCAPAACLPLPPVPLPLCSGAGAASSSSHHEGRRISECMTQAACCTCPCVRSVYAHRQRAAPLVVCAPHPHAATS
eukprot:1160016-Pelagomonas_calceolata.AAC.3